MVAFNDRRESIGSGDFNNSSRDWKMTPYRYDEESRWRGMPASEAKGEVHSFYSDQKDTQTWSEATRLAKRRTDNQARREGFPNGSDYALAYQNHLAKVMNTKGRTLAEQFGEIQHRQSGYGRT